MKIARALVLACAVASLAIAAPAVAAPGSVDPTFGSGGQAQAVIPDWVTTLDGGLVRQSDGKLVAAGTRSFPALLNPDAFVATRSSTALTRFMPNGKPDPEFGEDGWLIDDRADSIGRPVAGAADTIVLPGSKFIESSPNGSSALVARYTADGVPDTGFGDGGVVRLSSPEGAYARVPFVAVDRDGSLFVAYEISASGPTSSYALAHLAGDGALDPSFGDGGYVTTPDSGAGPVVVTPDGGIVVATTALPWVEGPPYWGQLPDIVLKRYGRDGRLDTAFGDAGSVDTGINAEAHDLVVDRKGNMSLVTPSARDGLPARQAVVARFDRNGAPLGGFGQNGVFQIRIGQATSPAVGALQGDGNLIVAGSFDIPAQPPAITPRAGWAFFRVKPTGKLDRVLGNDGVVTSAQGLFLTQATGVVVQDRGQFVVGGTAYDCAGRPAITLIRFLGDDDTGPDPGPLVSTCPGTLPVDSGAIPVVIACPLLEDTCSGDVVVDQYVEGMKRQRAGKARFRMDGNQSRTAKVRLSSRARAFARSHRRFKVLLTIKARDADGHRHVLTRRVNVAR